MDEALETFRDACLQAAVHGETEALREAASAARDGVTLTTVRGVLDAAAGSRYLPRLERDLINLWVPL